MRAPLYQPTALENENLVGGDHRRKLMRHHQCSTARAEVRQRDLHRLHTVCTRRTWRLKLGLCSGRSRVGGAEAAACASGVLVAYCLGRDIQLRAGLGQPGAQVSCAVSVTLTLHVYFMCTYQPLH